MNCQEFDYIVNDLAQTRPMDADSREAGLVHAASCERCDACLKDHRALHSALKALAVSSEMKAAPSHVEMALLATFRQQAVTATKSNLAVFPVRQRPARMWMLAAAAALLVAGFTLAASIWLRKPSAKEPIISVLPHPSVSPVGTPPKSGRLPNESALIAVGIADPDGKPPVKPRRKNTPRPSTSDRSRVVASVGGFTPVFGYQEAGLEVATDFFPLMNEQSSQPLESGQLIRVQMPRSALASFGLPVNYERTNIPVKADVLLADDGSARAIRFVR